MRIFFQLKISFTLQMNPKTPSLKLFWSSYFTFHISFSQEKNLNFVFDQHLVFRKRHFIFKKIFYSVKFIWKELIFTKYGSYYFNDCSHLHQHILYGCNFYCLRKTSRNQSVSECNKFSASLQPLCLKCRNQISTAVVKTFF